MSDGPVTVLFLCTGNSARSILAEAILNDPEVSRGRFRGVSAGSHPKGAVNPAALEQLRTEGLPTDDLRSKSWDAFAGPDAPAIDIVITLCDEAAGETCPIWPGRPLKAHWGLPDPAAVADAEARRAAFRDTAVEIRRRLVQLTAPPVGLDAAALQSRLSSLSHA